MSLRAIIALALIGITLLGLPLGASAQDAYTVEVAVADRSPVEQDAAYRIAMRRVLLDNAGDKTLLNRTDVRQGLAAAKTYVVQFSYRAPTSGEVIAENTPVTDKVRNTGEATQIMKVRFDRERIRDLIKGKPESEQATTAAAPQFQSALVWMLIKDGNRDLIIGGANGAKVMQRSREIAGGLGIVLSFPAADTVDIDALGGEGALSLDQESVLNASLRYTAPAILSANISRKQPVGWQGVWERIANDQVQVQNFEAGSLDELLRLGLTWMAPQQSGNAVASQIASPSAPLASESSIWFSGVQSIAVQPRSALSQVRTSLSQVNGLRETARPVLPDGTSPSVDAAFVLAR